MKKIVDVSGFGHSGKSAVSEFLADHEVFFSFPINVEFELFRVRGGLVDLYYSIYHNWNLIRSNESIHAFEKLVKRIGEIQNYSRISTMWRSSGHGYNNFFGNSFISLSLEYINDIILFKQDTFWPYARLYQSSFVLLLGKVKSKLFNKLSTQTVLYTNRNDFLIKTSNYVHKLFNNVCDNNASNIVLNNAFDPFNPSVCLNMVENSYSIVVDRDPRDIYASLLNSAIGFIPEFEIENNFFELKKMIVGSNDVDEFILRYKTIKGNVENISHDRLLRIRYEDFVLNHEVSKTIIFSFLGITNFNKKSKVFFNQDDSKLNIGIWKKYRDLPEIAKIEKELAEYCYQL
ncbi:hypothetical protein [Aquirufa echingensis]|uniref:Sulfotransferase n=1 Tax=Aquirufa echingensis TaxID=3096516 RepID=A0ABW6CZB0_9BACT